MSCIALNRSNEFIDEIGDSPRIATLERCTVAAMGDGIDTPSPSTRGGHADNAASSTLVR